MSLIRDPKTSSFDFDCPKNVDENLNYEIGLIKRINESLAENKIKNEIKQLLSKYTHGNNIYEHQKQQSG